jgi:hypothetical protein
LQRILICAILADFYVFDNLCSILIEYIYEIPTKQWPNTLTGQIPIENNGQQEKSQKYSISYLGFFVWDFGFIQLGFEFQAWDLYCWPLGFEDC